MIGFYCLLGIVSLFKEESYGIFRFKRNFLALVEILAFSHITYRFSPFTLWFIVVVCVMFV